MKRIHFFRDGILLCTHSPNRRLHCNDKYDAVITTDEDLVTCLVCLLMLGKTYAIPR